MSLIDEDFEECQLFFSQSLPDLIAQFASSLSDIDHGQSVSQQVEKLGMFLDLIGTECIKEVTLAKCHSLQNPDAKDQKDAHS
ncbi:protein UL91 [Vespertilionid gammaherpesvirus 1]|uniref:Protein UL91 n=1 Tax=Vespertilionid gammaherpesvirus 1 TaxID=2560830 RepID=A0A0X9XGV8_9GAMA|nr:protein UL91 [Myotis gammaherpesvirus 8]AMA67385.1 protein UL91 [Vespertilionid gammaherpesvirus 1]